MNPNWLRRGMALVLLFYLSIFFQGCAGPGVNGHDLRGGVGPAGSVVRSEFRFAMAEGNILITIGDRAIQGRMEMDGLQVKEEEVMALAEAQPARVKLRFVTDQMDTRQAINGAMNSDSERGPLSGRTLIGNRAADRWSFQLDRGIATPTQVQAMRELELGFGQGFYPKEPVALGESWELPATAVKQWLGHELIRSQGTARFTLESVTERGGERCAKVAVEINAGGRLNDPDGNELELSMGLEGHIYRSLESHVDMAGELTGLMVLEGEVRRDGTVIGLKVTGPVKVTGSSRRHRPSTARAD